MLLRNYASLNNTQPQFDGIRLNRANNIARKITQGINWQGRNLSYLFQKTSDTSTYTTTNKGKARRLTGSGNYITSPTTASADTWSMVAFGVWRTASLSCVITHAEDPGSGTRDRFVGITAAGAGFAQLYDGSDQTAQTSNILAANSPFLLAAIADGSSLRVWCNGSTASTAASNTGYAGYATPELVYGYGGSNSANGFDGATGSFIDLIYGFKCKHVLTIAELYSLYTHPFQIFAPPISKTILLDTAVVAASTYRPTRALTGVGY
jgi:hypothetical protein